MTEREALVATLAAISAKRLREETMPQMVEIWNQLHAYAEHAAQRYSAWFKDIHAALVAAGYIVPETENARRRRVWRAKREGRR